MRLLGAGLLLALALPFAQAGEEGLAGNWKISIYEDTQAVSFWILQFENVKGEWSAKTIPLKKFPSAKVTNVKVGEMLSFSIKLENGIVFEFEGKLPKAGGKKILGSFGRGANTIPALLEATTAKNGFDLDRDFVTRFPNDPRVFSAVLDLLGQAKANKASEADVRDWVETAIAAGEAHGPRWKKDLTIKIFDQLLSADAYAAIAVDVGQRIDKGLDAKAPETLRLRLWEGLATALRRSGKADQAKAVDAKIDSLVVSGYDEHVKKEPFPIEKFKGRKGKSKRAVLVELFTGAQCAPCVAADVGFDGLGKAFKPSEVVLLQYHLHIPGPDALTNADTEARQEFYGRAIRGTPAILFNGKSEAPGGGAREDAEDFFQKYRAVVEKQLEKDAGIEVTASAVRKDDKVHIQASVKNIEAPSKDLRLRLALVEDWARYQGRNGMIYHHRVVRALPGGADGMALTKKDAEKTVVVDLDELRKKINAYLDDFQKKEEEPFPDSQRPLRLRDLHVVAFVQNDDTSEVLQAVDVAVKKSDE